VLERVKGDSTAQYHELYKFTGVLVTFTRLVHFRHTHEGAQSLLLYENPESAILLTRGGQTDFAVAIRQILSRVMTPLFLFVTDNYKIMETS
jgi:hypothetical protein